MGCGGSSCKLDPELRGLWGSNEVSAHVCVYSCLCVQLCVCMYLCVCEHVYAGICV